MSMHDLSGLARELWVVWLLIIFGCLGLTFLPIFLSNVFNPSSPVIYATSTPYFTPTP